MKKIAAGIFLFFLLGIAFSGDPETVRPFFCVDGDTFIAAPDSQNYRLWGVDAPELDQPWGVTAKSALISLIHRKRVKVEQRGTSYNRPVVRVVVRDKDVGLELLKMGLAWYCPEFAPDREDYREAEKEARAAGRGLWSDPKPVNPADHRKSRKTKDE